ncbi:uncharacterized protein LOC134779835 isoform X1 [Penaeus indicus]|uniref:uncharacterized protein LOC134779835 isoform X1 n=2 Tax=Penaeus indicus TaxID=29960 RepID=UPI00300C6D10
MEGSSVVYLPTTEKKPPRNTSFAFLSENNFSLLKPNKTGLLQGPRRVLRLCVFVLVLPTVLITIPLYVRLVLYPPAHYPMMPTDQRLLSGHVSSFWCQAQSTHMNGSFNAYHAAGSPQVSDTRRTHVMLQNLKLKDDIKEYWGFYFLKGTTVTLSTCAKWDGGQLMVLRGVENLRRCAWIGEKDSAEDMAEDDDPLSQEKAILLEQHVPHNDVDRNPDSLGITGATRVKQQHIDGKEIEVEGHQPTKVTEDNAAEIEDDVENVNGNVNVQLKHTSEERKRGLTELLRQAIRISKGKKEILKILHKEGKDPSKSYRNNDSDKNTESVGLTELGPNSDKSVKTEDALREAKSTKLKDDTLNGKRKRGGDKKKRRKKGNRRDENLTEEDLPQDAKHERLRRSLQQDDLDGAFEDEVDDILAVLTEPQQRNVSVETSLGAQIFYSEGLKFERGMFNQSTAGDNSREEHRSSYSSSEEALASCEGVILTLPLVPYKSCDYRNVALNKIVYDIPVTGTYYFVFSSDNEIYINDLYFNITMERVVYDVGEQEKVCGNATDCSLPLNFWSDDQMVVDVPQEQGWDHAYLLDTKCEPRVYVYLILILFVPLLIMCCAFH